MPVRLGLEGRTNTNIIPSPKTLDLTKEMEDQYPKVVEKNIDDILDYYGEV